MLRIAGFEKESFVDGPGIRYTIFTQGCGHNCEGCHNSTTHSFTGGKLMSISEIYEDIIKYIHLDGVTLSGGDPMYQAEECYKLAKRLKENTDLDIWCYTGFTLEELLASNNESVHKLLEYIDVLVDGMFEIENKSAELRFMGSTNQRVIDVKKSLEAKAIVEWEEE